jgi:UvrD-like helicase family protein
MSAAYLDKLNPDQRRAVEHGIGATAASDNPALLVIAGAGSGKTGTLAHRVVHLAANGADIRRILLGSRQLGHIRRLPDRRFHKFAAVLLDRKFRVLRGAIVPYEVVEPRASYVDILNAWRFTLRDSVWDIEGVVDVTDKLKAAELLI